MRGSKGTILYSAGLSSPFHLQTVSHASLHPCAIAARRPPDGLRFYVDFETCDAVLWERYFHCQDLGRDLVPVIQAFRASTECRTGQPTGENVFASPPLEQDTQTEVPPPFSLVEWIESRREVRRRRLGSAELCNRKP